jgi:hypothetical protein
VRLSDAIEVIARRTGVNRGRTAAIANRLQHASMIGIAEARKAPPEITPDEMAWLLLAVLAERGVGDVAKRVAELGATGLHNALAAVLRGQAQSGDIIVRDGGATATINGQHIIYGQPPEDGQARFCTGPTLEAIVAEYQGAAPHVADAVRAINRI